MEVRFHLVSENTMTNLKLEKLLNIKETQQHPFHVLTSSKLPILVSILAGGLALTFIAKLHGISADEMGAFSFVADQILNPLFTAGSLSHISTNLTILYLMAFLVIAMFEMIFLNMI